MLFAHNVRLAKESRNKNSNKLELWRQFLKLKRLKSQYDKLYTIESLFGMKDYNKKCYKVRNERAPSK